MDNKQENTESNEILENVVADCYEDADLLIFQITT